MFAVLCSLLPDSGEGSRYTLAFCWRLSQRGLIDAEMRVKRTAAVSVHCRHFLTVLSADRVAPDALERRARNAGVVEQRAAGAHLCSGHVLSDAHLLAAQIDYSVDYLKLNDDSHM